MGSGRKNSDVILLHSSSQKKGRQALLSRKAGGGGGGGELAEPAFGLSRLRRMLVRIQMLGGSLSLKLASFAT